MFVISVADADWMLKHARFDDRELCECKWSTATVQGCEPPSKAGRAMNRTLRALCHASVRDELRRRHRAPRAPSRPRVCAA